MFPLSKRCWNCRRPLETFRSERTGIEYCASCGAATNGGGFITAMNEVTMETGSDIHGSAEKDHGEAGPSSRVRK
jgi:ribosomal protein L37AE/L43A